jgi:hypothetical protein
MTAPSPEQVTRPLKAWSLGQDAALADETAEVLKVSPDTALRDWKLAKSWLAREMGRAAAAKYDA